MIDFDAVVETLGHHDFVIRGGTEILVDDEPVDAEVLTQIQTLSNRYKDDQDKQDLKESINAEREKRLHTGKRFNVSWQQTPIRMTGRTFDQTVILALLQRAMVYQSQGVTDPIITYRDGENVIHHLTPAQFIELGQIGMNWVEQVMAASWAMKDSDTIPTDISDDSHWPG